MRCLSPPSQVVGPSTQGPHRARARGCWSGRPAPESPSNCKAWRRGVQQRSASGGAASERPRLVASTAAARTAHTPAAGRGWASTRPQSPTANSPLSPSTARLVSVSTRPLSGCTGRPEPASQGGA